MDPSRIGNDISGGTRDILLIFKAFSEAHAQLEEALSAKDSSKSILSCIIGGHYQSYFDQRNNLKQIWDSRNGNNASSSRPGRNAPPGQSRMMGQVQGPPAMLGGHVVGPTGR